MQLGDLAQQLKDRRATVGIDETLPPIKEQHFVVFTHVLLKVPHVVVANAGVGAPNLPRALSWIMLLQVADGCDWMRVDVSSAR
jgi:hypothetical protein